MTKNNGHRLTEPRAITEGAMKLISTAAQRADSFDRDDILMEVCEELENRWPSKNLEQRLVQMGLETTEKIYYVIDVYLAGVSMGYLS